MTTTINDRISALTPRLQKYAARHATDAVTKDDLFQIAVEEIINHCTPSQNDTYMLQLADWRMRNAVNRERRSYQFRIEEIEVSQDTEDDEEELQMVDYSGQPEEELILREQASRIQEVISKMPSNYITILQMLQDGLSQHETARQLKTSQPRIRYHILKIRAMFEEAGLKPTFG